MKRICVFCGSGLGRKPEYIEAAKNLGDTLARHHIGMVFGGGQVGLMGVIAQAVHQHKGEVIGVIPQALYDKEVAFTDLPDLRIVKSMHERKALMEKLSDGFIAMPGGLGTIEEFFEVLTWAQLGMHGKPCGILNVCHYFDKLINFLDNVVNQGFIEPEHRDIILIDENPESLLKKFKAYLPPKADKAKWALEMMNS
jgi:uncharacterized protein (TIGR00730 family)